MWQKRALLVEAPFQDQGVEVWVEPQGVAEWLNADDHGAGDGLAAGGAVELRDQVKIRREIWPKRCWS